jgi:hypothetical protein
MIEMEDDFKKLLESKVNSSYTKLQDEGYVVCGDRYVSMNLRIKLDIDRSNYFIVNFLSAEYFICTTYGARKLLKLINSDIAAFNLKLLKSK